MGRQSNIFERVLGSLEDAFSFGDVIAGTMTAEALRAIDRTSNQEVTVWRTRGPLQGSEVARFQERLLALRGVPRVARILSCGVDRANRGFAVLGPFDGRMIDCAANSEAELEERFAACSSIVEALHQRSITCGDICLDSFLVNDRGAVSLFAVLGDVALEYEDSNSGFNPHRYLPFVAPEQNRGGVHPPSVDTYALARLREGLSAVRIEEESAPELSRPAWMEEALATMTATNGDAEVASGRPLATVLEGLAQEDESDKSDEFCQSGDERSGSGTRGDRASGLRAPMSEGVKAVAHLCRHPNRVFVLALLNVVAFGVLAFTFYTEEVDHALSRKETGTPSIKGTPDSEELAALYDSDDPAAYQKLLELVSKATDAGSRDNIFKTAIFRARRQGLGRTADVILTRWSNGGGTDISSDSELYRHISRLLDPTASHNVRLEELARLYQIDPRLSCVMAAAMALDSGEAEAYRGLFAKAVEQQTGYPQGAEHNSYSLMLSLRDIHDLFSSDILDLQERIPPEDIVWLLEELGKDGRPEVATVARIADKRGIIEGARVVFARELHRSATLSARVQSALVSGALGKLSGDDIKRFREWYDPGAARVLAAAILTAAEPSVRRDAFDALTEKPVEDPYAAGIMDYVREGINDDNANYYGVVAAVIVRNEVGGDALKREFENVKGAPHLKEFLKHGIAEAPPQVLLLIVSTHGDSMDPLDLIDLLSYSDPAVRSAAISYLTTVNDIMLLKLISQAYDDETNPTVRAEYQEKISIVKDRLS
jgi:hypothetical protein